MPTLSLCLMVKNEEQFLERCLNSVKNLADEIVVVDTGSTDRTKEIAAKFTVKIYDFPWCNDFSAGRNESLRHASGDWILVLDADEIISGTDHQKIKELIQQPAVKGYSFPQRNYTQNCTKLGFRFNPKDSSPEFYPESKNYLGWTESWIVRLFANDPRIRFRGQVHELVEPALEEMNEKISLVPIPIHHYHEEAGSLRKAGKLKLYREIGEDKIKKEPHNAKAFLELGLLYQEQGEFSLAEEVLGQSLMINPSLATARLNLALAQQKQNKFDSAITNFKKVLENKIGNNNALCSSSLSEAHSGLGFCFFKKNDLLQAERSFIKAIECNPQSLESYINLGAVFEKENKLLAAVKILSRALIIHPNHPRGNYNLGVVYEKIKDWPKALVCYEKTLSLNYPKPGLKERVEKIKSVVGQVL